MNEKFYTLSKEKQDTIINAGFKVFSDNSYKKMVNLLSKVSR